MIEHSGLILVVDDVPANLKHLAGILEREGYQVKPAQNGEMALQSAQSTPPDLIILDVMMPGMNGYEVCDRLKTDSRLKEIPVIFISALEETDDKVKAFSTGGVDFLSKPFEPQEVLARVNTHLKLRRLQLSLKQAYEQVEVRIKERTYELEEATRSLRASEIKYRELVESANSIILRLNQEGHVTFFNEYAQKFFGYTQEEILNQPALGTIVPLTDFSGRDLRRMIMDICAHPELYASNQNENIRRNGERVWIVWTNKPIYDAQGQLSEILCIGNDITEQKRLESQLLRAQRIESVGRLANGVAHDLNNVLTPIQMFLELLREKLADPEDIDALELIRNATQRGSQIVQQLLVFSRGTSGTRVELDLRHHIREISQIITQTFPKSIILESRQAPNLWTIYGDPTQIHQVLLNLSVNARDAMPDGGTLNIEAENITLDDHDAKVINAPKAGQYVLLNVSDTGAGISADIIEKIFEPFFTTKAIGQGTGLGLSTVLGIVKGHGGFIQVDSQVGSGSVFRVYWPASKSVYTKSENFASKQMLNGCGACVLIADDEKAIRDTMRMFLKAKGFSVLTAQDGNEALRQLEVNSNDIRLVIVDLWMPTKDGYRLIQEIERYYPQIRVIATSGMAESEFKTSNLYSVKAFLRKPWLPSELLESIDKVLKES